MRNVLCLLLLATSLWAQRSPRPSTSAFEIEGVVVNASSGQPLVRAKVAIASVEARDDVTTIITGQDGRFRFQHLRPGKYSLSASRIGFPPQSFDQHLNYSTAIAVGPDLKSTGLVFRMKPEAVISGSVHDEADEPVRDAEVLLFHRAVEEGRLRTHFVRQTNADDQGSYRFSQLPEGDFLVAVRARPWYAQSGRVWNNREPTSPNSDLDVAYPTTFYPGVTEPESAAPIVLRSGEQASIDFVLRAVPAAHLHVRPANPDPSRNINGNLTEKLFDNYDGYVQTQNFWQSNALTMAGFAPGRYTLHVNTPAGERKQDLNIADDMSVDPDTLIAVSTAKVQGRLSIAGFTGSFKDALLQLHSTGRGNSPVARVSPDGSFEMPQVEAGAYEVRLFNVPEVFIQNVTGPGARGKYLQVGGSDVSLTVNASRGAGKITGTVLNGDSAQSGAMVLLVPERATTDLSLFRRDQSDSDGTFTLRDVSPGRYLLMAIMDGWDLQWSDPNALKPYLAKSEPVEVQRGAKYDVKVTVQPR